MCSSYDVPAAAFGMHLLSESLLTIGRALSVVRSEKEGVLSVAEGSLLLHVCISECTLGRFSTPVVRPMIPVRRTHPAEPAAKVGHMSDIRDVRMIA